MASRTGRCVAGRFATCRTNVVHSPRVEGSKRTQQTCIRNPTAIHIGGVKVVLYCTVLCCAMLSCRPHYITGRKTLLSVGEVHEWYEKLTRMMKTVEEWGRVQARWLYLLPIFSSKDIVNQMQEEGKLFEVNYLLWFSIAYCLR